MPRRHSPRCSRRGAGATIDLLAELCLLYGHAYGIEAWELTLRSRSTFDDLWSRWRDDLTDRWTDAYPGSRPMAAYMSGEIAPPNWQHELAPLRHPVTLAGSVVIPDRAWHNREVELEHLAAVGVVDDQEYAAALTRFEDPSPTCVHRYNSLADPA